MTMPKAKVLGVTGFGFGSYVIYDDMQAAGAIVTKQ